MSDKATKSGVVDKDYSLEAIPETSPHKKGFWGIFVLMLGFTFFSASMSVGARMANGLGLSNFVLAVILGGLILSLYTGLLAYIGQRTGLSMDLLAQRAFGTKGSYLPSAMISFTQIGWFGVGAGMFAYPVSEQLGISPVVLVIIVGALMTATAYFGITSMTILSFVACPLIAVLGCYSMFTATAEGGGWAGTFGRSQGTVSLITGIGMVVGSFISGGTATPNFVRFSKTAKTAVFTTVFAFFLGNTLMFLFGAVGGAYTGEADIFYVMIAQGLAIPAIIVLGLNIWTTNDSALYTAGLGLSNITKIRKKPVTMISGAIATATAIWLYNNFIGWLSFLNATLPPVGAILVLDYFLHKDKYKTGSEPTQTVNIWAVCGVIAGALVANFLKWGIASINAMAVAVILYLIGNAIKSRKKSA